MKSRLLIIIGILITFTITFFVLGPSQGHIAEYFLTEEQFQDLVLGDNPHVVDSIDGFAIDDAQGNVKHYPIDKLDEMPCEDFIHVWQEVFRTVDEHKILIDKYQSCYTIPEYAESQVIFDDFTIGESEPVKIKVCRDEYDPEWCGEGANP